MKRKILTLSISILGIAVSPCIAQQVPFTATLPAQIEATVFIKDTTAINYIGANGVPIFYNTGINSLVAQYQVGGFGKAYPLSRYYHNKFEYTIKVSSLYLLQQLQIQYPTVFGSYTEIKQGLPVIYTPNDFPSQWPLRYTAYMDYINIRTAWDYTHGSPNTILGFSDTYLYTGHPDMQGKIAQLQQGPNVPVSGHGTVTSGLAVANTDNNIGWPGIGFDCKVDFIAGLSNNNMLSLSQRTRKVINASFVEGNGLPTMFEGGLNY